MKSTTTCSFNTLYTKYYRKCFLFVKSYIHNDLAAEDIAAEALIKLWEKMKEEEIYSPKAFLLSVLKNKALDYLRHEVVKNEAIETVMNYYQQELDIRISTLEACNPDQIFSSELQQLIRSTLEALPEQTRKVIEMSRFQELSNKEIAEILHLTPKGVEYHITKALKMLRTNLKDYLPIFYFFFYFQ